MKGNKAQYEATLTCLCSRLHAHGAGKAAPHSPASQRSLSQSEAVWEDCPAAESLNGSLTWFQTHPRAMSESHQPQSYCLALWPEKMVIASKVRAKVNKPVTILESYTMICCFFFFFFAWTKEIGMASVPQGFVWTMWTIHILNTS